MRSYLDGYLTDGCKDCKDWTEKGCATTIPIDACPHYHKMMLEDEKARLVGKKSRYYVYICTCGHIHFIPREKIEKVWTEDNELLFICKNCGRMITFGADPYEDGHSCYNNDFYNKYRYDCIVFEPGKNSIISHNTDKEDADAQHEFRFVIISSGYAPLLNDSERAAGYGFGGFFNSEGTYEKVDMHSLNYELPFEKKFALSRMLVKGISWEGTIFEK